MNKRLTLNLGLRFDYQRLPKPLFPNPAIPETTVINSDRTNFGPRAAVAWDIKGDAHTVIRAGYGMFFSPTPLGTIDNVLRQTGIVDPTKALLSLTFTSSTAGAPIYPTTLSTDQLLAAVGATGLTATRLDPNFRRPRAQEINFGVERLLPGNIVLSASYVYTKGDRLPFTFDTNLPAPAFTRNYQLPDGTTFSVPYTAGVICTVAVLPCPSVSVRSVNLSRPLANASIGAVNVIRPLGLSWYHAFLLEATKRLSKGYEFHIAYTLARAEDVAGTGDGSGRGDEGPFGGFNITDQFNIAANRSRASTDQRHRLVVSDVWNLPVGKHGNSLGNRLIRNWRVSNIFTAQSGRPYGTGTFVVTGIPFTANGMEWNGFGFNLFGQGAKNGVLSFEQVANDTDAVSVFGANGERALGPVAGIAPSIFRTDPQLVTPNSAQANVGVEHLLSENVTVRADYLFTRGVHLPRTRNINLLPPVTLTTANAAALGFANPTPQQLGRPVFGPGRVDPRFDAVYQLEDSASSTYNGLTLALNKRMSSEFELLASYTLSKTRDDASDFDEQPQNPFDLRSERALSRQDVRQRFVLNALFDLPFGEEEAKGAGSQRDILIGKILGQVEIAPIVTLSSGRPVNPLTGTDEEHSRAFPLASRPFGFARNSLRTPRFINFDLRVLKYFPMGDRRRLDLVIEAFNVFNHPNVLSRSPFFGSGTAPLGSFGTPTSFAAPRQVRFSIDFEF